MNNNAKYLMFDVGGVLDGTYSDFPALDKDLLIKDIGGGLYQVLKDGVDIIQILNTLVDDYGYKVVLHSKSVEQDQTDLIQSLTNACKEKNLKFPKILAMAVRDEKEFKGYDSLNPKIIKNRTHGIWVAGYDKEEDGKQCVRNALSVLLNIEKTERSRHIIFDDGPNVIALAKADSWQGYEIGKDEKKARQGSETEKDDEIDSSSLFHALNAVCEMVLSESVQLFIASSMKKAKKNMWDIPKYPFRCTGEKVKGGSSPSIQYFINTKDDSKWIGKCSQKAIGGFDSHKVIPPNPVDEYKEYLSIKLYSLFGVKIPEVTLSEQPMHKEAQLYSEDELDFTVPRLQYMSRFIEDFKDLGEDFFNEYKNQPRHRYCQVQGRPLKGLGRALAVAKFLYDFDCIGNSGTNMGYVDADGPVEVIKIDAGEALPFIDDMSNAKGLVDLANNREMLLGTGGSKVSFWEFNRADQLEYILTVRNILNCTDEKLESIFKGVISNSNDPIFRNVLECLTDRKRNFIKTFSPEVGIFLDQQMKHLQTQKAEGIACQWTNPCNVNYSPTNESKLIVQKAALHAVRNTVQTNKQTNK